MTESAVYLQPAFILQQRKYRETSLIIDALTRDFGRVSVLAKGVRKIKSKTAGLLQPFIPLSISYVGKTELKTLSAVERRAASGQTAIADEKIRAYSELQGLALYCGFYINELITCFLHKYDPHPELFDHYSECLFALADGSGREAALRQFELNLMENVGYGLSLELDETGKAIKPSAKYDFQVGHGAVENVNGPYTGKTLLALNAGELTDPHVLSEAKILMRSVIDVYLQGRQLKSRAVINSVFATAQRLEK